MSKKLILVEGAAWQKKPATPIGTAIDADIFDAGASGCAGLKDWLYRIFS